MYTYNPHRHVKIWLSKDPSSFLNQLNQLRLVRMRGKNPHDTIHFAYDSLLLFPHAIEELNQFCILHNIIPFNISDIQREELNDVEQKLMRYYDAEINFNQGGNPAAASDIVRFIAPLYKLGTYTDFDVEVRTKGIEPITVTKPILLSIGSIIQKHDDSDTIEQITLNNDRFAVVDIEAAQPMIESIQQEICLAWEPTFNQYPAFTIEYYKSIISQMRHFGLDDSNITPHPISGVQSLYPRFTPPQLRTKIRNIAANNVSYAKFLLQYFKVEYDPNSDIIDQALSFTNIDISKLNQSRGEFLESCLFDSVVYITGPIVVRSALFPFLMTGRGVHELVEPLSLDTYGLDKVFLSNNKLKLHTSLEEFKATRLQGFDEDNEDENDLSWMLAGEIFIQHNEKKLNLNATKIQSFFHKSEAKKSLVNLRINKISEKIDDLIKIKNHNPENELEIHSLTELSSFINNHFKDKKNYTVDLNNFAVLYSNHVENLSEESTELFEKFLKIFSIELKNPDIGQCGLVS